jgi:hypothetical protein
MTDKLQVKEHLRNGALYRPVAEPSPGAEWKRRLFYQHTSHQQLKAALQERPRLLKRFICIGIPILCITLAFAVYIGFVHPESWFKNLVPVVHFDVPPMGLKETLIFIAVANGLTLFIRKRAFTL